MTDTNLKGKVAVVTGGGRGIGRAVALGLAERGAKVVLAARSEKDLADTATEIKSRGGDALAAPTDLMVGAQIDALVEAAVKAYGHIDILVNNAARSYLRPLMDLREDGWDKIFGTNVKALWLLSRAAAKQMAAKGGGRIVNITTIGAVRGGAGMAAYHASKAAVSMLSKCMAVEWAALNINVNCVGPGLTKTDFSRPLWENPEVEKMVASRIPKGRLGEVADIVPAVLFLCSDGAGYITGETIYVDGGSLANY
ncbi:MAG: SDR family oxidoreductase [Desulfobacterales bacterium]